MLKFSGLPLKAALISAAAFCVPVPGAAAALGPHANLCESNEAAALVKVEGLKTRTGTIRVQIYEANSRTFLEKRKWLHRVDVPVTRNGPMQICAPVPRAGNYVVSVRHDVNGNAKSDRSDGGGFSGNPKVGLMDLVLKRKPDLRQVQFSVGSSTREVQVTLRYLQGGSFSTVDAS